MGSIKVATGLSGIESFVFREHFPGEPYPFCQKEFKKKENKYEKIY